MRHCWSGAFGVGGRLGRAAANSFLRLRGGGAVTAVTVATVPTEALIENKSNSSSDSSACKSIAIVLERANVMAEAADKTVVVASLTTIFYSWQHQLGSTRPARELVLGGASGGIVTPTPTWRYVRYLLETKFFAKSLDYIVCVSPGNIRDETILRSGTRLILKKLPGKALQREIYIPPEVRGQFDATMTEDEKLSQVIRRNGGGSNPHPSITAQQLHKVITVPATYICNYCMEQGTHHVRQCPRREKNLPSRKLPTGFPLSLLREARTDEERERAFLTTQGKYVIQREVPMHRLTRD